MGLKCGRERERFKKGELTIDGIKVNTEKSNQREKERKLQ